MKLLVYQLDAGVSGTLNKIEVPRIDFELLFDRKCSLFKLLLELLDVLLKYLVALQDRNNILLAPLD